MFAGQECVFCSIRACVPLRYPELLFKLLFLLRFGLQVCSMLQQPS